MSYHVNMLVTLDTNVSIDIALSVAVFNEYEDVLGRPELQKTLGLKPKDIEIILSAILIVARRQSVFFRWRPNLSDEKDNLFVELAVSSASEYLITSNTRDFIRAELKTDSFELVTPAEFLRIWRSTR